MVRDRELVSDVDRNRALLDIIEHVRKCKIKLTTDRTRNYVSEMAITDGVKKYKIALSKPTIKGIEPFTALNHECFHILFESPIATFHRIMNEWSDKDDGKYKYYLYAVNLLEDQRIESLGGSMWLGTGKRFLKMRKKRGVIMQEEQKGNYSTDISPAELLLYIRFMQGKNYLSNKYFLEMKQALEDVEMTGKWGSLKVMIKIKPILDEWWSKNISSDFHDGNCSYIGEHKDDMEEEVNQDNVEKSIAKEKGKGIKQMEEVNDKINETVFEKEDVSYVEYVKGEASNAMYNEAVANNMRKLFRRLTMVKKNVINDKGNEVDIESFITNKIEKKNLNDCLIDRRIAQGVSVLISIDVSSSMSYYEKIDIARKLVGTLFKSVEDLKNVEVKAQTWSSHLDGKLRIQEINNYNETKYITAPRHGETPTHLAIKYASMTAKKMKGHKKLIIILTDGHPQYHKNKHKFFLGQLITMSKKAMVKALRQNPNIMCVHLGRSGSIGMMTQIFGAKRFIHTENMNEASETIIKKVRQLIMRTMSR